MNASESELPPMNTTDGTSEAHALSPDPSISSDTTTANNEHAWTLVERRKKSTVLVNQVIGSSLDVHMAEDVTTGNNVSIAAPVARHTIPDERESPSPSLQ